LKFEEKVDRWSAFFVGQDFFICLEMKRAAYAALLSIQLGEVYASSTGAFAPRFAIMLTKSSLLPTNIFWNRRLPDPAGIG